MQLKLKHARVAVDLPHALFVTAIVAWAAWYLHDAIENSQDFVDLLLIEPVAVLVFVVYLFILRGTVSVQPIDAPPGETQMPENFDGRKPLGPVAKLRIFGSMALVVLYVTALTWIGFDVATFAYVAASLVLLGERRWWMVVLVPLVFCVICIYLFNQVLQMPLPLTLIPAQ